MGQVYTAADTLTASYFVRARELVQKADRDPVLTALALHLEGDLLHIRDIPYQAVERQQAVTHTLQATQRPQPTNQADLFSLEALTQRLLVLDAPLARLRQHELKDAVGTACLLADAASVAYLHERTMLLEAVGRSLAILHEAKCWEVLETAISEARGREPLAYVSGQYSYLVAEHAYPRTGRVDQAEVLARGKEALAIADTFGWQRRSRQIKHAAARCGVNLA